MLFLFCKFLFSSHSDFISSLSAEIYMLYFFCHSGRNEDKLKRVTLHNLEHKKQGRPRKSDEKMQYLLNK